MAESRKRGIALNECCENCKFYARLKISKRYVKGLSSHGCVYGWTVGKSNLGKFDETHCCLMFVKTENEPYVLEVEPTDMCEMFTEREG